MAFCNNCGNQLAEGANFCSNCGAAVDSESSNQRATSYDGVIHKCPNCGEVLSSFVGVCPTCGYELRDSKANNSVQALVSKLQQIENEGSSNGINKVGRVFGILGDRDERKLSLIKNFPIPNTKEDIFEFAVLAATNVDAKSFTNADDDYGKKLSDAWLAKLEQAYRKAKIVLDGDTRLIEIQALYDDTHKSINEEKKAEKRFGFGILIVLLAIIILCIVCQKLFA